MAGARPVRPGHSGRNFGSDGSAIDFGAGQGYYVRDPLRATFVDPILGSATPVYEYEPGTWGPREADRLLDPGDRWRAPAAIEAPA